MQPHDFWQILHAPGQLELSQPYGHAFPVTLEDGRQLLLPIRPLADGEHALASLIINQASFAVLDALAEDVAEKLKPFATEIIVGLPTLGLTLAARVAQKLGHSRYVPMGTSRKFWYREDLSVALSSITTPEQQKRLYLDPRMLPLLEGRRVGLIDDVISSGRSIRSGLDLLAHCGVDPVVVGSAMLQTDRWRQALDAKSPNGPVPVIGAFKTPQLMRQGANWIAG